MGKKKAKKRSTLVDSGRDSVNIDITNGQEKKQSTLNITQVALCITILLNLILLHIILISLRQQAITLNNIYLHEQALEEFMHKLHSGVILSLDVLVDILAILRV